MAGEVPQHLYKVLAGKSRGHGGLMPHPIGTVTQDIYPINIRGGVFFQTGFPNALYPPPLFSEAFPLPHWTSTFRPTCLPLFRMAPRRSRYGSTRRHAARHGPTRFRIAGEMPRMDREVPREVDPPPSWRRGGCFFIGGTLAGVYKKCTFHAPHPLSCGCGGCFPRGVPGAGYISFVVECCYM
jgi:hypothetical protein